MFLPEKPRSLISDSSQPLLTSKGLLLHEDYSSETGPQQQPMHHSLSPSKQRPAVMRAVWAPAPSRWHGSRRPACWVTDQGSGCQLLMNEFSLLLFDVPRLMHVRPWCPRHATGKAAAEKFWLLFKPCQFTKKKCITGNVKR